MIKKAETQGGGFRVFEIRKKKFLISNFKLHNFTTSSFTTSFSMPKRSQRRLLISQLHSILEVMRALGLEESGDYKDVQDFLVAL